MHSIACHGWNEPVLDSTLCDQTQKTLIKTEICTSSEKKRMDVHFALSVRLVPFLTDEGERIWSIPLNFGWQMILIYSTWIFHSDRCLNRMCKNSTKQQMWYIMVNQFLPFWFLLKKKSQQTNASVFTFGCQDEEIMALLKCILTSVWNNPWKINKSLWFIYWSVHERTMSFVPRGWQHYKCVGTK